MSRKLNSIGALVALLAALPLQLLAEEAPILHPQFNFERDITPLLSRYGCNSSGCHGKAEGQNGFKLSVFGYDAESDYRALVIESRGRRVSVAAPDQSLLVLKMSGAMPHGGGARIRPGTAGYQTIRDWIAAGARFGEPSDAKVVSIRATPEEGVLRFRTRQALRVLAQYSDGSETDVTALAQFQSNNEALAQVDENGVISVGDVPGQAAVMARYMSSVAVFQALIPRSEPSGDHPPLGVNEFVDIRTLAVGPAPLTLPSPLGGERVAGRPREGAKFQQRPLNSELTNNFIDDLVDKKLQKLNIRPSVLADDAEYLRRIYLDVIGSLPTAQEARAFLSDPRPDRRLGIVDQLLDRPEYADYWALKWADVLRVDRQTLGPKDAYAYYRWIRESLAENKTFDRMVRELITAEGPLVEVPQGNFYKLFNKPGDIASSLSQIFLGVRIACAECHHHPFDRWSQKDFYGMQAYFQPVARKKTARGEALLANGKFEAKNPRSGEIIQAHPLGDVSPKTALDGDRRTELAAWFIAPENPWFARNMANRLVAHFLGRGLVEPVDDVRATNPASNPELLDALARYVAEQKFDVKSVIRLIAASRTYQLSSRPNETNERDEQNYSRALFKRMPAEVLLDAICQVTGVGEKFAGVPMGYRAIQLWDSDVSHYFLKIFGRPTRKTACECERNAEASISQVLHLLNSPEIENKIAHEGGRVAKLLSQFPDDSALVEELYLTFYNRFPTAAERQKAEAYLRDQQGRRRQATEDLAWTMINSLEFVFNH